MDYGIQYNRRMAVLALAAGRFQADADYEAFLESNREWLGDYALFMAIKVEQGNVPWLDWPLSP
ncbi:MAG: 4-alpha-glucanotransferase [Candidatus Fimadaptatus sp.]